MTSRNRVQTRLAHLCTHSQLRSDRRVMWASPAIAQRRDHLPAQAIITTDVLAQRHIGLVEQVRCVDLDLITLELSAETFKIVMQRRVEQRHGWDRESVGRCARRVPDIAYATGEAEPVEGTAVKGVVGP